MNQLFWQSLRIAPLFLLVPNVSSAAWPDIRSVSPDLRPPLVENLTAAAGRRVRMKLSGYERTDVCHALYLPTDWKPEKRYPVIVEYAGNGPFRNQIGDTCSGKLEDCNLGYGISGGRGFIWLCLPYVSEDRTHNETCTWGDVDATVDYCKRAVALVCEQFGGNRNELFLAGFSRGSVACHYIGLHDEEIAGLWLGFICHSHYDGVRGWDYAGSDRRSAAIRLARLNGRPEFISQEKSIEPTKDYLSKACPKGEFVFQTIHFRNHTDRWVLRDVPQRQTLRNWVQSVLSEARSGN